MAAARTVCLTVVPHATQHTTTFTACCTYSAQPPSRALGPPMGMDRACHLRVTTPTLLLSWLRPPCYSPDPAHCHTPVAQAPSPHLPRERCGSTTDHTKGLPCKWQSVAEGEPTLPCSTPTALPLCPALTVITRVSTRWGRQLDALDRCGRDAVAVVPRAGQLDPAPTCQ